MIRLRFRKGRSGWIETNARDEAEAARIIASLEADGYRVERY